MSDEPEPTLDDYASIDVELPRNPFQRGRSADAFMEAFRQKMRHVYKMPHEPLGEFQPLPGSEADRDDEHDDSVGRELREQER